MVLKQANMAGLVLCYFALHQWCRKMIQDVTHRHQYSWPQKLVLHNTFVACSLHSTLTKAREEACWVWRSEALPMYFLLLPWEDPLNVNELLSHYSMECKAGPMQVTWRAGGWKEHVILTRHLEVAWEPVLSVIKLLQAMNPCKCSWLAAVTCIVAKRGNAFLTRPSLSALGQIVVSASRPLNQRHKAAYVQATLMYDGCNDSDYTSVSLMHLSLRSLPSCSHLVSFSSSALVSVSVFFFSQSLLDFAF